MNSSSQLHIRKAINSLTLLLSITHHDFLDFQLWFYVPFGGIPLLQHQTFVAPNDRKFTNQHGTPAKFSFADSTPNSGSVGGGPIRWVTAWYKVRQSWVGLLVVGIGAKYLALVGSTVECVALDVTGTGVVPYSDHARKRVAGLRLGEERSHQEYRWEPHFV
jgi:hypothetical protein